jgi:chromosome segregation protein
MSIRGAEFRNCDFQVHSPRDGAWRGARPSGSTASEIRSARREWAKTILLAATERGLGAIAITDHHEGVLVWDVVDEASSQEARGQAPWVFPGMELTTKDAVQALLIFDADTARSLFEKARNLLGLPSDCNELEDEGLEVECLSANLEDLQARLDEDDELRGHFIILPNVTPNGHKTVLRKGFHRRFRELPFVGGYLDRKRPTDLAGADLRILRGEIPAWSSHPLGVLATSDARDESLADLGRWATWMKLAEPTAESIRQALLASNSRLAHDSPPLPAIFVDTVRVTSEVFDGFSECGLNRQFNAIIGGRGAGKSALLELVRFALGRSARDGVGSSWDITEERRRAILDFSLGAQGIVELDVSLNGATITLTRTADDPELIRCLAGGNPRSLSAEDVRALVPLQVFSQGEISSLGRDEARARLFELITDTRRDDFRALDAEIEAAAATAARELAACCKLWELEQSERRLKAEIDTLVAQETSLKQEMRNAPESERRVVNDHAGLEAVGVFLTVSENLPGEEGTTVQEALERYLEALGRVYKLDIGVANPVVAKVRASISSALPILKKAKELVAGVDAILLKAARAAREEWGPIAAKHEKEYREAVQRLAGYRKTAELLQKQQTALAKRRQEVEAVGRQLTALGEPLDQLGKAVTANLEAQRRRIDLVSEVAAGLKNSVQGLARGDLARYPDCTEVHDALRQIFSGTRARENRLEDLARSIEEAEEPLNAWRDVLRELFTLIRWKIKGLPESAGQKTPRPRCKVLDAFIDSGSMDRLAASIDRAGLEKALRATLKGEVRVFQSRGNEEVEFGQASQGEQAATLLTLLMAQPGGPLIVDQPEEDLDNRVVNDIVAAVETCKQQRQVIFATHNANLVVNGDAENVLHLRDSCLTVSGAIDEKGVRDAITECMEGGRKAFELRRKKYNF